MSEDNNNLLLNNIENQSINVDNTDVKGNNEYSNQFVLAVTCASFGMFVAAEIIGALASNSLSLLGDASAMSVDVFTYFTNMWAERIKSRDGGIDERTRLILEVAIPSFSVTALIGVTIYVTIDAFNVILYPSENGENVNVLFLYGFSVANMFVDILSSYMFYSKGKAAFLHQTEKSDFPTKYENSTGQPKKKNLNMISAFTHVGGDSLRTLSVFVAAVISTLSSVPSDICDAWAAIFVTITIFALIIPLIVEIYKAATRRSYEPLLQA
eukprot:gene20436-26518_t